MNSSIGLDPQKQLNQLCKAMSDQQQQMLRIQQPGGEEFIHEMQEGFEELEELEELQEQEQEEAVELQQEEQGSEEDVIPLTHTLSTPPNAAASVAGHNCDGDCDNDSKEDEEDDDEDTPVCIMHRQINKPQSARAISSNVDFSAVPSVSHLQLPPLPPLPIPIPAAVGAEEAGVGLTVGLLPRVPHKITNSHQARAGDGSYCRIKLIIIIIIIIGCFALSFCP